MDSRTAWIFFYVCILYALLGCWVMAKRQRRERTAELELSRRELIAREAREPLDRWTWRLVDDYGHNHGPFTLIPLVLDLGRGEEHVSWFCSVCHNPAAPDMSASFEEPEQIYR